jgi:maltose alpha-D-glucosyltransferase/alpha-amylase
MTLTEVDAGGGEIVRSLAEAWRKATEDAFLDAYRETIAGCASYPEAPEEATRLLDLFLLEKALYEICYEAANRPHWVRIPLKGVTGLLELEGTDDGDN